MIAQGPIRAWLLETATAIRTYAEISGDITPEFTDWIKARLNSTIGHQTESIRDLYLLFWGLCFKFLCISPWPEEIAGKLHMLHDKYGNLGVSEARFVNNVLPALKSIEKDLASIQNSFPREVYDL